MTDGSPHQDTAALAQYIQAKFSESVKITPDVLFGKNLTLAQVITESKWMTNSVDLMESFAKTANALRKDHGLRIRLPALSLDTPISEVLSVFLAEAQKSRAA